MTEQPDQLTCSEHGDAHEAFVCAHLLARPDQFWHCDAPAPENPWPDAWCGACQREFEREGGWNERNGDVAQIKLICNFCYEAGQFKSVRSLDGAELERWREFHTGAHARIKERQARVFAEYDLNGFPRYDWDQERAELVFSGPGAATVIAKIEFSGSLSKRSNTWLWSWANFNLEAAVRSRIPSVRATGEEKGFRHLTIPKWPADEVDGWEMTVAAADLLGAEGVYRTEDENGFTYMLLMGLERRA